MLMNDNVEATTPQYIIQLKINGFEDEFPLVFSGENGHLDFIGHEMEVLDISIY